MSSSEDPHKKAVTSLFTTLQDKMSPNEIINYFFQEEIITLNEMEDLHQKFPGRSSRVGEFLNIIMKKKEACFTSLVKALKDSCQYHLAETLEEKLHKMLESSAMESSREATFIGSPRNKSAKYVKMDKVYGPLKKAFESKPATVLLHGREGSGKTELVLQLANDSDFGFQKVLYALADSKTNLESSFQALCTELQLHTHSSSNETRCIQYVVRYLKEDKKRLLILDNCGEYTNEVIKDDTRFSFLAVDSKQNEFSVLLISRLKDNKWTTIVPTEHIGIPKFEKSEIKEFVKQYLESVELEKDNLLEDVQKHCAGEPILLKTMLENVVSTQRTLREYVDMLEFEGNGSSPPAVYSQSFSQINREDTYVFMYFFLLCDPSTDFDLDLLRKGVEGLSDYLKDMKENDPHQKCPYIRYLRELLNVLQRYEEKGRGNPKIAGLMRTKLKEIVAPAGNLALLTMDGSGVRMHSKVQEDFLKWVNKKPDFSCETCKTVLPLCFISILSAASADMKEDFKQMRQLRPHAEKALKFVFKKLEKAEVAQSDDFFDLACNLHHFLYKMGCFGIPKASRTTNYFDSAIAVLENVLTLEAFMKEEERESKVFHICCELSKSYLFQGSAEEARESYKRAEQISRNNPNTDLQHALIGIAAAETELDNYDEAKKYLDEAARFEFTGLNKAFWHWRMGRLMRLKFYLIKVSKDKTKEAQVEALQESIKHFQTAWYLYQGYETQCYIMAINELACKVHLKIVAPEEFHILEVPPAVMATLR